MKRMFALACLLCCIACGQAGAASSDKAIHVVVALCDNTYQGIVPVPARLGDGEDLAGNLYWGAAYGVKTFMRRQNGWEMLESRKEPSAVILERIILYNRKSGITLVADGYKGSAIKEATEDFLLYSAGGGKSVLAHENGTIQAGGNAGLIVYVGHNGLMDFSLERLPANTGGTAKSAAVFACQSKSYFAEALETAGAEPLIWTRGNMAPEAYTLHALAHAWAKGDPPEAIRRAVAEAYNKYQKCGMKGALRLFASGR